VICPTFGSGSSGGGAGFERGEPARHLAGLVFEPFRLVGIGLAPARLVNGQDRSIEDAVAQRLQAQCGEARARRRAATILPPPARSSRKSRITRES